MTRNHLIYIFICAGAFVLLLVAINGGKPYRNHEVTIEYEANTNSVKGPVALLRLTNRGKTSVILDPFCTVYWTNRSGEETNMFFEHNMGYAILHPGQSNRIAVAVPMEAKVWDTSFTYQMRPNALRRIYNWLTFVLPLKWEPDNSFICRIGPKITNSASTAEGVPVGK